MTMKEPGYPVVAELQFVAVLGQDEACKIVDVSLRWGPPCRIYIKDPVDQRLFLNWR
jgi:hypothetical protein